MSAIIILELKEIRLLHQYRARPACKTVQSDLRMRIPSVTCPINRIFIFDLIWTKFTRNLNHHYNLIPFDNWLDPVFCYRVNEEMYENCSGFKTTVIKTRIINKCYNYLGMREDLLFLSLLCFVLRILNVKWYNIKLLVLIINILSTDIFMFVHGRNTIRLCWSLNIFWFFFFYS